MTNVATEKNIETLRQVAMLLERENSRLHSRLQELAEKLAHAEGKDAASLQMEIAHLKETLANRTVLVAIGPTVITLLTGNPASAQWSAEPGATVRNVFGPSTGNDGKQCRGACGGGCPSSCCGSAFNSDPFRRAIWTPVAF